MARDEITTREAAHLLGCTVRTVSRLAETGELQPSRKLDGIRGARLFYRRDVQKLARQRA